MNSRPGAVFVVDVVSDVNAVREANKLGIPIVALIDTNADPSQVTYPIPANDDSIKTIQLVADYIKAAIETGKAKAKKPEDKDEAPAAAPAKKPEPKAAALATEKPEDEAPEAPESAKE